MTLPADLAHTAKLQHMAMTYNPPPMMPLPVNYGAWHLEQGAEFKLPYDIAFLVAHGVMVPVREPPPFVKARSSKRAVVGAIVVSGTS